MGKSSISALFCDQRKHLQKAVQASYKRFIVVYPKFQKLQGEAGCPAEGQDQCLRASPGFSFFFSRNLKKIKGKELEG